MNWIRQALHRVKNKDSSPAGRTTAILANEGLLSAVMLIFATSYTSMFALRIGATDQQVGLISSLPQLFALLVMIPGALLASRLSDRRRPVEISLLLAGFIYGLAGFSPYLGDVRVWYFIGLISLANAPVALYTTSWQNYFSDIIPAEQRNAVYTRRTSRTFIASVITVQAIGLILGGARTDTIRITLYQCCYWLAFAVSLLQCLVLRRAPSCVRETARITWRDFGQALRVLAHSRRFLAFAFISFILHAGWYMAWPLFTLIQVRYIGADETWLSLVALANYLVPWLTMPFWSKFIEKHGIRFTLVIGCLGMIISPITTLIDAYLPPAWMLPALVFTNCIYGLTFGAFQLTILQCLLEVVPLQNKPLNLSLYTAGILLTNAVLPTLGVQLYAALGSDLRGMTLAMTVSILLRTIGTVLFFCRWLRLRREPDSGMRA
ncbi:MAG TPA: hypothetical protein DD640_02340 [Clostridiales bacterium]|nr:hypothetical protein [Clostridiales bacterium]